MSLESTRIVPTSQRKPQQGEDEIHWIDTIPVSSLQEGKGHLLKTPTGEVAVFLIGNEFRAVQNLCPHKGASLSEGRVTEGTVHCPLHHWQFDLTSGECLTRLSVPLTTYPVRVAGQTLQVGIPGESTSREDSESGIHRVLVTYSRLGWVECFGTIEPLVCSAGEKVVVQTARGLELGTILVGNEGGNNTSEKPTGELLRLASDEELTEGAANNSLAESLLKRANQLLEDREVPVEVIDAEQLWDGQTVILYYLGLPGEVLGRLAVELGEEQDQRVMFQPVVEQPRSTGCGSGGCGSGGCSSH